MPKQKKYDKIFAKYFVLIMICFGSIGFIIMWTGFNESNQLISAIGTSLFSSGTIGLLFKWTSLDLFVKQTLTDTLVTRDYLAQFDNTVLERTQDDIEKIMLKRKGIPEEVSNIFRNVRKDFGTIYRKNFNQTIKLRDHEKNPQLSEVTIILSYNLYTKNVLDYLKKPIIKYWLDKQESFDQIKPQQLFSFKELQINDERIKCITKHDDKTAPATWEVNIDPQEINKFLNLNAPIRIEYTYYLSLRQSDVINQQFWGIVCNFESRTIFPKTYYVEGCYFIPGNCTITEQKNDELYVIRSDNEALPGNGYSIFWRKK